MPRKAKVLLTYQVPGYPESDFTLDVKSFQYSDPASGQSDTISVTLNNIDQDWNTGYLPTMGDIMTARIETEDMGQIVFCGRYCIDDCSMTFGKNWEVRLDGTSIPETHAFRSTEITRTWQNVTLEAMISEIAGKYKLTPVYVGIEIPIETLEQKQKTDCAFITETADKYGMAVKVFNGRLIIYSEEIMEAKDPVATISLTQDSPVTSATYNHSLTGVYTGATLSYSDPKKGKDISVTVGTPERLLKITEKCDNEADARKKAIEKLNASIKNSETLSISMMGNTELMSTQVVEITGAGKVNGNYFIDKVSHSISSSGYTMSVEMHKVQKRFKE